MIKLDGGEEMGWEWHDRKRDRKGHFVCAGVEAQLHVRCTEDQLERIRVRASARQQTVSAYILSLVRAEMLSAKHPETVKISVPLDAG